MPLIDKSVLATKLQTIIDGLTVSTETKERLVYLLKASTLNVGANADLIRTQLETDIENITTSTNVAQLNVLLAGLNIITTDRIVTVPTYNDLPSNASTGAIFFVDSGLEGLPYIKNSSGVWVPLGELNYSNVALAWGSGSNGRLGDGTTTNRSSPVSVVGGYTDWIQVATANAHNLGLRANGTAWAWGNGAFGQLGDGTALITLTLVSVVGGFTDWIQVDAGDNHSLGLRADGTAWAWGSGSLGRLGDGTIVNKSSPVSVVGGYTDWIQVYAGSSHSLGIRANGTAWAWGSGLNGRLGDGTAVSKSSPVSVVGGFTDWLQVSGDSHNLGVRANGTAWAWGNGSLGRLGDGTVVDRSSPVSVIGGFTDWIQVAAGDAHSLGLRANGTAYAWGANNDGRLGDGTAVTKSSPVSVVGGYTDWIQVSGGGTHSLGLRANGTAWAWGIGSTGQLGDGTAVNKSSPVSVIGGFTDWIQVSGGDTYSLGLRVEQQ
jgi:alpha-tubulin suppressor-like RCC1 family protein